MPAHNMRPFNLVISVSLVLGLFACDLSQPPLYHPQADAASGAGGQPGSGGSTGAGVGVGSGGSASGAAGSSVAGGAAGTDVNDAAVTDDAPPSDDAPGDAPIVNCAGHALQLDGTGYLQANRIVQDDFTLEAWIKTTTSLTGSNFYEGNGLIYADVGGVANDFGSSILNDRVAFGVGNPDTTVISFSTVTTGQWVHVAATRTKSTGQIEILVNGELEGSMTVAQTSSLSAQSILSFGANTIDGRYFTGVIDEIRLFSVVRTAAEIASTMHKPLDGTEPGLVTYYRLDESDGTSAADGSPSKNDATLAGGGTWIVSDAPICP